MGSRRTNDYYMSETMVKVDEKRKIPRDFTMMFYHFSINCHDWDYFPYDFSGPVNCVTIFHDFP